MHQSHCTHEARLIFTDNVQILEEVLGPCKLDICLWLIVLIFPFNSTLYFLFFLKLMFFNHFLAMFLSYLHYRMLNGTFYNFQISTLYLLNYLIPPINQHSPSLSTPATTLLIPNQSLYFLYLMIFMFNKREVSRLSAES